MDTWLEMELRANRAAGVVVTQMADGSRQRAEEGRWGGDREATGPAG